MKVCINLFEQKFKHSGLTLDPVDLTDPGTPRHSLLLVRVFSSTFSFLLFSDNFTQEIKSFRSDRKQNQGRMLLLWFTLLF